MTARGALVSGGPTVAAPRTISSTVIGRVPRRFVNQLESGTSPRVFTFDRRRGLAVGPVLEGVLERRRRASRATPRPAWGWAGRRGRRGRGRRGGTAARRRRPAPPPGRRPARPASAAPASKRGTEAEEEARVLVAVRDVEARDHVVLGLQPQADAEVPLEPVDREVLVGAERAPEVGEERELEGGPRLPAVLRLQEQDLLPAEAEAREAAQGVGCRRGPPGSRRARGRPPRGGP